MCTTIIGKVGVENSQTLHRRLYNQNLEKVGSGDIIFVKNFLFKVI